MLKNLQFDYNLRGYAFEYIARILLRRERKNNFIFLTSRFDHIFEIITKYKLKVNKKHEKIIDLLKIIWNKCDIIEFQLQDKQERKIKDIIFYDVKTSQIERDFFEVCESNFDFMTRVKDQGYETYIISIKIFDNWRFSFNILKFFKQNIRRYSNFKKG